jgi:hypothetical protein
MAPHPVADPVNTNMYTPELITSGFYWALNVSFISGRILNSGIMVPDIEQDDFVSKNFSFSISGNNVSGYMIPNPGLESWDYAVYRPRKKSVSGIDYDIFLPELSPKDLKNNDYGPKIPSAEDYVISIPKIERDLFNYDLGDVPTFDKEFQKSLLSVQNQNINKLYSEELVDFLKNIENNFTKHLKNGIRAASNFADALTGDGTGNKNLVPSGEPPVGYVYSMDRGKVGWEEVDWTTVDPFLAANGIIKIGNTSLRPDLHLRSTNTRKAVHDQIREAQNDKNVEKYYDAHFSETKGQYKPIAKSIYYMMSSGADFIQNMFDVAIVFTDENGIFEDIIKSHDDKTIMGVRISDLMGHMGRSIMVRTSSIEVPQMESDTFITKFLGMSINKVRTKIKYERKSNLKILADEPLYMRLLINLLSGNVRSSSSSYIAQGKRPIGFHPGNLQHTAVGNISILVKHEALLNYPILGEMKNSWRKHYQKDPSKLGYAENSPAEYPVWWFQDVRFAGEGTDLQFDRDGSTTTELTFPFIFSRCIKIDRSAKFATDGSTPKEVTQFFNVKNTEDQVLTRENETLQEVTAYQNNQEWMWRSDFWKGSMNNVI